MWSFNLSGLLKVVMVVCLVYFFIGKLFQIRDIRTKKNGFGSFISVLIRFEIDPERLFIWIIKKTKRISNRFISIHPGNFGPV